MYHSYRCSLLRGVHCQWIFVSMITVCVCVCVCHTTTIPVPREELTNLWIVIQHNAAKRLQIELHDTDVYRTKLRVRRGSCHGSDVAHPLLWGKLTPLLSVAAAGLQLAGHTHTPHSHSTQHLCTRATTWACERHNYKPGTIVCQEIFCKF